MRRKLPVPYMPNQNAGRKATDKRVEKNGSWQLEQSGGQLKSIFYITEGKGLYSLIQIIGNDAASLEHGKRLLEQLKTDTPALFPKEY